MIKLEKNKVLEPMMSRTTRLFNFLIKIHYLPLEKTLDGFKFSMFSWRFLISWILYYYSSLILLFAVVMMYQEEYLEVLSNLYNNSSFIDSICVLFFVGAVYVFCPIFALQGIAIIPTMEKYLSLQHHFPLPLNCKSLLISFIIFESGFILFVTGFYLGNTTDLSLRNIFSILIIGILGFCKRISEILNIF